MPNFIFSVDVEDWFHILDVPSAPAISEWSRLPSHVEKNFLRLLDIFSERNVAGHLLLSRLGGERFPHLVQEAVARGHEIASHGYGHRLVFQQAQDEFYNDVRKARLLLEDMAGAPVMAIALPDFRPRPTRRGSSKRSAKPVISTTRRFSRHIAVTAEFPKRGAIRTAWRTAAYWSCPSRLPI